MTFVFARMTFRFVFDFMWYPFGWIVKQFWMDSQFEKYFDALARNLCSKNSLSLFHTYTHACDAMHLFNCFLPCWTEFLIGGTMAPTALDRASKQKPRCERDNTETAEARHANIVRMYSRTKHCFHWIVRPILEYSCCYDWLVMSRVGQRFNQIAYE